MTVNLILVRHQLPVSNQQVKVFEKDQNRISIIEQVEHISIVRRSAIHGL